ncbi:hypothetical protein EH165_13790 [Nakamurella antarctica]|uniref:Uncharacterized protein n=1 Tax=Nakamurella antarctica TaxID=1902245 RepID=A0A3G8ZQH5_9ACTN|nr:hypothetical protein [Nakamurella antarctica]AZI59055.1 hypothetical protein EH165_13790 [Nakamurella antarctica]
MNGWGAAVMIAAISGLAALTWKRPKARSKQVDEGSSGSFESHSHVEGSSGCGGSFEGSSGCGASFEGSSD